MKLWLIERLDDVGYDEYDGKVIAAPNAERVREIAALVVGDEGKSAWLSPERSQIEELGTALDAAFEGVVLASYRAG